MLDKPGRTAPHAVSTSVLLDASGAPLPKVTRPPLEVDVRDLPLIAADALPPLPSGIEARLYRDPDGDRHQVVLWCPEHELSVALPLVDTARAVQTAARMMQRAIAHALTPVRRVTRRRNRPSAR